MATNGNALGNILNEEFFVKVGQGIGITLSSWSSEELTCKASASKLDTSNEDPQNALKGVFKFTLKGTSKNGEEVSIDVAVKSKVASRNYCNGFVKILSGHGSTLRDAAAKYIAIGNNIEKSMELEYFAARLAMADDRMSRFRPRVFHALLNRRKELMVVVMEFVEESSIVIGGNLETASWREHQHLLVLGELAKFHALYIEDYDAVERTFEGFLDIHPKRHLKALPLWQELYRVTLQQCPHLLKRQRKEIIESYFAQIEDITQELLAYPMTFVHNDPHIGNLWLRNTGTTDSSALCLCDWELCCIHVPQRDLVTFIGYGLQPHANHVTNTATWDRYIKHYREELEAALSNRDAKLLAQIRDDEAFNRVLVFQVLELLINRMFLIACIPNNVKDTIPYEMWLENCFSYIEEKAESVGLISSP